VHLSEWLAEQVWEWPLIGFTEGWKSIDFFGPYEQRGRPLVLIAAEHAYPYPYEWAAGHIHTHLHDSMRPTSASANQSFLVAIQSAASHFSDRFSFLATYQSVHVNDNVFFPVDSPVIIQDFEGRQSFTWPTSVPLNNQSLHQFLQSFLDGHLASAGHWWIVHRSRHFPPLLSLRRLTAYDFHSTVLDPRHNVVVLFEAGGEFFDQRHQEFMQLARELESTSQGDLLFAWILVEELAASLCEDAILSSVDLYLTEPLAAYDYPALVIYPAGEDAFPIGRLFNGQPSVGTWRAFVQKHRRPRTTSTMNDHHDLEPSRRHDEL